MDPIKPLNQVTPDSQDYRSNFKAPKISTLTVPSTELATVYSEGDEVEIDVATDLPNLPVVLSDNISESDTTDTAGITFTMTPNGDGTYGTISLLPDGTQTVNLNLVVDGPDAIVDYQVRWATA